MSDFRGRLTLEFNELTIRYEKLVDFLMSEQFSKLSDIDRNDLTEQARHMKSYLDVLNRRVSRLCGSA